MKIHHISTEELSSLAPTLNAGDKVFLSGTVYTARDAAHKKIFELIDNGSQLPFPLSGSTIYYAGPTPTPDNMAIGSCGPTTSTRMDSFAPKLYDMGVTCTIGKGERQPAVIDAIVRNSAIYLCAIGGAGALAAECITECDVIAFKELGCESVKRLVFKDFPLFVGIDSKGNKLI